MKEMSNRLRKWAAVTLLSVMCLGSSIHFLHHVFDPDCDPNGHHGTLPCTCSALHGGALAPQPEISAPQAPGIVTRTAFVEAEEPESRDRVEGTPRAPPAA